MAPVLAILSAVLYSGSMIMARIGLKYLDAFSGVLISMASSFLASLFLVIFFVPLDRFTGWALLFFVLSGLAGPCIGRFMLLLRGASGFTLLTRDAPLPQKRIFAFHGNTILKLVW